MSTAIPADSRVRVKVLRMVAARTWLRNSTVLAVTSLWDPNHSRFGNLPTHQHQEIRRLRVRPCENLHYLPGMPSERRRLLIDQRDLYQLHVDCKTQSPVELIEQRGFPA